MVRLSLLLLLLAGPAAAASPGKTLEIIASPRATPIIAGEMVPITIRGVYDRKVALEEMTITPSAAFDWIQLVPDIWSTAMVNGLSHLVVERKLAVFAKVSGIDTFGPVDHAMTVIGADSRREEVTVHAQPLSLSVAPMPDGPPFEQPWGWRFAAAKLSISETLSTDPAKLVDGETVTRRVTLRAEGVLPEMLPPRPVIQQPWLIAFAGPNERTMERSAAGLVSSVTWTWQFRPETGEPGVLPPVPIPFFNTTTRRIEAVEIPPLPIGYASFKASQQPGSRMTGGLRLGLAAALAGGLAAGLALQAAGQEAGRGWLRRTWQHHSPLPRWRLRRAAREGDLLALRRAAEAYLPADRAGNPALRLEAVTRLERAIYRPGVGFDPAGFVRDLRRARRGVTRETGGVSRVK